MSRRLLMALCVALVSCQSEPIGNVPDPDRNHPPVAVLDAPSIGVEGDFVQLSGRRSSDPDGDSLEFFWTVYPKHSEQGGPEMGVWIGRDSTYALMLVVTDPTGAADTATATLVLTNAPPEITTIQTASMQALGNPIAVAIDTDDPGRNDPHTVTISWGDGESTSREIPSTRQASLTHTYLQAGSYSLVVSVKDEDGAEAIAAPIPIRVFDPTTRGRIAGYETLDLGTFGGAGTSPSDINDRGQVVGFSLTTTGAKHAFVWENDVLRDLGTLGRSGSEARVINESGVVAGVVIWESGASSQAIWRDGAGMMLDTREPSPGSVTMPVAINAAGDVLFNISGHEFSYEAFLWRNGRIVKLPPLYPNGSQRTQATDMNERGQVSGATWARSVGWADYYRGVVWEQDRMRVFAPLDSMPCIDHEPQQCSASWATDINERGQVVGAASVAGGYHYFLWDDTGATDLGAVNPSSQRIMINDRGDIAWSSGERVFFMRGGNRQELPLLGGRFITLVGMNESGMIAGMGTIATGEQHVFVWSPERGMVDLGTGPQGLDGAAAVSINGRGDVVGISAACSGHADTGACLMIGHPRATLWRALP